MPIHRLNYLRCLSAPMSLTYLRDYNIITLESIRHMQEEHQEHQEHHDDHEINHYLDQHYSCAKCFSNNDAPLFLFENTAQSGL